MPRIKITHIPKAQVGVEVVNRPQVLGPGDDEWIYKIMNYEADKGGYDNKTGKAYGLSNYGYNTRNPNNIQDAVEYFKGDILPQVQNFPMGMRERLADYKYNTGRSINDLLLYNAGKITLDQLNSPQTFDKEWEQNKDEIQKMYSDPNFINKLDQSKDDAYRTTKQVNGKPNPAYAATWKGRTNMWDKVPTTSSTGQQPIVKQPNVTATPNVATSAPIPTINGPKESLDLNSDKKLQLAPGAQSSFDWNTGTSSFAKTEQPNQFKGNIWDVGNTDIKGNRLNPMPTNPNKGNYYKIADDQREADANTIGIGKDDRLIGYNTTDTKKNNSNSFGKNFGMYAGIAGAGVNIYDNYQRQKDYDQWTRNSNLSDNYYAVNTNTDRGDYDINNGMFRPNEMGYKSKGTQANAYYAPNNFMRNGGMLPYAQEGVEVPYVGKNFVPEAHVSLPMNFIPQVQTGPQSYNAPTNYSASPSVSSSANLGDGSSFSNNPLNVHYGKFAQKYNGFAGRNDSDGKIAVFPDLQTGLKANTDLLFGSAYNNLPISQARNKWVSGDPTISNPSTDYIVREMGGDKKLNELSLPEKDKLFKLFAKWEDKKGYNAIKNLDIFNASSNPSYSNPNTANSQPSGDYMSPLAEFTITSGYGHRKAPQGPNGPASSEHNGLDLRAAPNTSVFAPMDGVVKSIYSNDKGGNQLIIEHTDGSRTGYAHLNGYKVNIGDPVTRGQVVALSGNTGNSNAPHLHFTYRNPQGVQMDPSLIFNFNNKKKKELGGQNNNNNMKIRIVDTPNEQPQMAGGGQPSYSGQSDYGLYIGQRNLYKAMPKDPYMDASQSISEKPETEENPHILEAEGGETIKRPDGTHMMIKGDRHTTGGVKLNKDQAPEGSFIYSDTKKMQIKDPKLLKYFGKGGSKSVTPADIAKQYDTNKYRGILSDPNTDALQKNTAKRMLDAYDQKLAELALVQEGKKGFPQGIPDVAKSLVEKISGGKQQEPNPGGPEPNGVQEYPKGQEPQQGQPPMQKYGGGLRRFQGDVDGSTVPNYIGGVNANDIGGVQAMFNNAQRVLPSWLKTWDKANTAAGAKSPAHGYPSTFNPNTSNHMYDNYEYWRGRHGKDFEGKNDREKRFNYQNYVFNEVKQGNPYAYNYVGENWGPTLNSGKTSVGDNPNDPNAPYFGARSAFMFNSRIPNPPVKTTVPGPVPVTPPPVNTVPNPEPTPIKPGDFIPRTGKLPPYDWTQQDINNVGAAGINAALIDKYTMQSKTVQPVLPSFTPVDWRGQAAALQSANNAAAGQLGTYLPGQSMASNLSSLAGQQAENLGNKISSVDQYNAQGENAKNSERANILNQFSQYNAGVRNEDRRYNNAASSQYKSALAHANDRFWGSVNQGITNAGLMYDMNLSESPEYYIDPRFQKRKFNDVNAYYNFMNRNNGGYQDPNGASQISIYNDAYDKAKGTPDQKHAAALEAMRLQGNAGKTTSMMYPSNPMRNRISTTMPGVGGYNNSYMQQGYGNYGYNYPTMPSLAM